MTAVTEIITHYKNSILNPKSDNKRLLHCINKLYELPISVNDLQATLIGRTVSGLRKIDGEVGVAAKALIAKWKSMVVAETISSGELDGDGDNNDNDEPPSSQKSRHSDENVKKKIESNQHSEHKADHKEDRSNGGKEHHHRRHNSDAHSSTDHKHRSSADKHHSKDRQHRDHKEMGRAQSSEQNEQSGMGDDEENRLIIDIKSEDKHSRDTKLHRSDRKDDKRSSGSSEHRSDKHKSSRNSEKSPQKSSEKADSSDRSNEKSSHHHHHRKRGEPSDGTSTSSKRKRPSDDNSPSKQSSTSSKAKKPKSETSTVDEIDSSMGTSFADALGMIMPKMSKGSKQKSSHRSGSSDIIKVAPYDTPKVPSDKTKSSKVSPASSSSSSSRSERKTKEASPQPPKLLSSYVALPPLEPVLAVEFPIISNNYKPMPLNPTVMDCVFNNYNQQQPKKIMTDEEAFGSGISSKSMRTKVYSGVKSGAIAQIPSLYQMCIRILQRNIDALEQIGSIPFDILKPVLQLASPEQLFSIESYNPYLMDDTDVLWQFHCEKKFRNLKRLELETWREMFLRCTEEREARFHNLTDTIKRSQTVAVPLKQTKLAYVNSAVKPPRGIIKKQNQFGTKTKLIATPAARVAALNNVSNNIAKPGDVRLRVAAGLRDTAQVTSNPAKTKSAAPLMQKSLQSFRSRFKR
ncbi:transcription elongation factor B polypeptide 3 [Bradysia coprophila]|uniref:transcription elongation factor B polypeptide 3 n=1 Tax=Bradysia coprophila TaxID=38358 RepID=UPI00187DB808|nr:transcription elongation factor B polypeptide 3 [Bradysia coprophila]